MPVIFSALMCHAPIVIPAVAKGEASACLRTTRAMREVAARLVAAQPTRLVLISPHSPRHRRQFAAWRGQHQGDLAAFGHPELHIELPDAPEVAAALGLPAVSPQALDHGAMVPLWFLWEAGWRGPTAILALPWEGTDGAATGRALAALPGATAVLASGDMSHRLIPGAPAGYHPKAEQFDRRFVEALRRDDWDAALDAPYQEEAAEDVVASSHVAMAAAEAPNNAEVLCYEGPWGVGYTEAIFADPQPPLYAIARAAASAALEGRLYTAPAGGPPSSGVFVTIEKAGELRGCIGHIEPQHARLFDEIADVAMAVLHDPRFPPVTRRELPLIDWEVSVMEPPEDTTEAELDPARYGVIVESGARRGLLLPAIEGVDTVAEQLQITRRKAGISPHTPVRLQRFTIHKVESPR